MDTIDKVFIGFVFLFISALGSAIYYAAGEEKAYSNLCNSKGGEVVKVAGGPNLCRDGNTLINVYKEGK